MDVERRYSGRHAPKMKSNLKNTNSNEIVNRIDSKYHIQNNVWKDIIKAMVKQCKIKSYETCIHLGKYYVVDNSEMTVSPCVKFPDNTLEFKSAATANPKNVRIIFVFVAKGCKCTVDLSNKTKSEKEYTLNAMSEHDSHDLCCKVLSKVIQFMTCLRYTLDTNDDELENMKMVDLKENSNDNEVGDFALRNLVDILYCRIEDYITITRLVYNYKSIFSYSKQMLNHMVGINNKAMFFDYDDDCGQTMINPELNNYVLKYSTKTGEKKKQIFLE